MSDSGIFKAAVKLSPEHRAAYLDQACGANDELRREVESLLHAHDQTGSFLESPPVQSSATVDGPPLTEKPGTIIGPYKLLQQIGEGGMGVVYMAEQREPVRRKVALKIIKPGMDSHQVVARFEAERQALAMMDHQNIARVLDAGTTESGRPYFVMELVHGVPITRFCDDNKLTPRERLALFVPVCQAIQHAHQKGIIHRDVKPSNVLVTMYDDKPVPKVIDFGVAKAIEQRLTEKTMFTQFGALVGTFEYMSPEQAEMNAFGVDTAQRHLLTGRAALRAADRDDAAGAHAAACGGPGRDGAADPGGGSAAAERQAQQLQQPAEDRGRAQDRAGTLVETGPWRDRLDRDEVPGKGPVATLRDGQRDGPRFGAITWPTSPWRRVRPVQVIGCANLLASTRRRSRQRRRSWFSWLRP